MPRGRPRKNQNQDSIAEAATAALADEPKETKAKEKSPMEVLSATISAAIKENPEGVTEMLASVLNTATGQLRVVPERRVVETKEPEKVDVGEVPAPDGAVFKSSSMGFKQVLSRSKKVHFGDDYEIVPPKIVDFSPNGTARLDEPTEIEAMRRKIKWRKQRGFPTVVMEVPQHLTEDLKDVVHLKNDDVRSVSDSLIS